MTKNLQSVLVPQLGVNDEFAVIKQWMAENRSHVQAGDLICSLETAKAVYDVHADQSGFILHLALVDAEVKVSDAIAVIASIASDLDAVQVAPTSTTRGKAGPETVHTGPGTATKKAQALAAKLGVSLDAIKVDGIITERHVRDHVAASAGAAKPLQLSWNKTRTPMVIYGGGNGGLTMMEAILLGSDYDVACFVDDKPSADTLHGLPLLRPSRLPEIQALGVRHFAVAIANGKARLRVMMECLNEGFETVNVIHPRAFVSPSVTMGRCNYIKAGAIVEMNTRLGDACLIDNGTVVAHDCMLEDACHLAPGSKLGSSVLVGRYSILGIGSSVSTGVKIGERSIISVGTSVVRNVEPGSIIEGVPGRLVGQRKALD